MKEIVLVILAIDTATVGHSRALGLLRAGRLWSVV
jgi:hypothetical protein